MKISVSKFAQIKYVNDILFTQTGQLDHATGPHEAVVASRVLEDTLALLHFDSSAHKSLYLPNRKSH